MKTSTLFTFIVTFIFFNTHAVHAQADYEEVGGVVVMEAESLPYQSAGWIFEADATNFGGFSGNGYLRAPLQSSFSVNAETTITVKIKINTPGTYIFKAKSRTGLGTDGSEHNDMWLNFSDADDFYGKKDGNDIVWPAGSGKTPNPSRGGGSGGFFKMYTSQAVSSWRWFGRTCDGCSYPIFADFNSAGTYTMLLSSRSKDYLLDRIVLSRKAEDVDETAAERFDPPSDGSTPETAFVLATSTFDLSKSGISIYPNPAQGYLNIIGLKNTSETIEVIDALGRVLPTKVQQIDSDILRLDTSNFSRGLYFVRIGNKGQSAFMVE